MELKISGKNIKLTPETQQYIERKLGKISRHFPNVMEAKVEITEEQTKSPDQRVVAQVTIDTGIGGILLRGEERADTLLTAIDKVTAVIDGQIEHYKGKLHARGRGSVRTESAPPETADENPAGKVKRVKRFAVTPMSVAEAVDQMELLRHDFFLFVNDATDELNLLYRRKDGNYGLITPEIE